ncbi:MAG: DUF3078 domain-containing protein [Bacteroidetes bacterium]|nr:DUF3078 domain-containing protein [Bacteroidota bacterium]MBV6461449.1 hypothetical protein [Flavobacteriales bacterium]WKZ76555.1 MAG: DUF3078 domain-containing protein [Vicingaceae bacterium]MCL4815626.1 DUF3078 domain-containing protein [Flavobacteriales bacterium]NOG94236.1 DUF3078 domain-containing protein [Bacteroidota bacterium]
MRFTIITTFLYFSFFLAQAQVLEAEKKIKEVNKDTIEGWKIGGILGINFSQTALVNWSAGGQNSIAVGGLFNLFANYKKGNSAFDNSLDAGFGMIRQGDNAQFIKSDDKLDITSKYGQFAFKNWYYAGLLNFKSQMAPGYNMPNDSVKISDFLAPGYLLIALGMDYKPSKNLNLFVAPLTGKITFVNNQQLANVGAFGVKPAEYDNMGTLLKKGEKMRYEYGGYIRLFFKQSLMDNVTFQTKLDLFSNYLNNPQNIDVYWESLLTLKVNKFITTSVTATLIYDHDIDIPTYNADKTIKSIGPRTQFKEVLAVGISFKF